MHVQVRLLDEEEEGSGTVSELKGQEEEKVCRWPGTADESNILFLLLLSS